MRIIIAAEALPIVKNKQQIYCKIRHKYVALTPEESVRQRIVSILSEEYNYPLTRFSLEAQISLGNLSRRYDIVVRDSQQNPFMLIECKAMNVKIDDKVIEQATSYNVSLKAKYVLLSNLSTTILLRNTENGYVQQKLSLIHI